MKTKRRKGERAKGRSIFFAHSPLLLLALSFLVLVGCTETKPTTQPATWADQAQADPADFDPRMDNPDISGGGISHFDKNAFDKDVNDVLNP